MRRQPESCSADWVDAPGTPSFAASGMSKSDSETFGSERSGRFTSGIQVSNQAAPTAGASASASWISLAAARAARVTPASVADAVPVQSP